MYIYNFAHTYICKLKYTKSLFIHKYTYKHVYGKKVVIKIVTIVIFIKIKTIKRNEIKGNKQYE